MIDENKLLLEISNLKKKTKSENGDYSAGYICALSVIEGVIAGYPKIGEWIPCNERMPEKEGYYLTTYTIPHSGRMCHELYFDGKYWINEGADEDFQLPMTLIAWQPLQEVYRD